MVNASVVLQSLHQLHDGLVETVSPFRRAELTARSYCADWSIAQVTSHLGSGAQITAAIIDAGLASKPAPDIAAMRRVWAVWDAKDPAQQAGDALTADSDLISLIDRVSEAERQSWRIEMDGQELDLRQVLSERLAEVTIHLWDMTVPARAATRLDKNATAILIDTLEDVVAHGGVPATGDSLDVRVDTTEPARAYTLTADAYGAALTPVPAHHRTTMPAAHLTVPAEALIRLVYGRLDPDHTPQMELVGINIDRLRHIFPGF